MDRYNPPYLDDEERDLIQSIDSIDTAALQPPSADRIKMLQRAARTYNNRASAKMNIRISPEELEILKDRAAQEGLKYQTLVKSILHKYLTGQLVDSRSGSA